MPNAVNAEKSKGYQYLNKMTLIKTFLTLFLIVVVLSHGKTQDILLLKTNGKVVIGDTTQITTPGLYNLYVQNGILTERVKVSLKESSDWSDDSFYHTPTLDQVEASIKEHAHLINIPSAQEVVDDGYELQEMDAKLLEQIEWLWQHMIELKAENEKLKKEIESLKSN